MRPNNEFECENEKIQKLLRKIAEAINKMMPRGWGFTLMLFDYSTKPEGSMFYISSADRKDMIKAMMEFVEKQQEGEIKN